MQGRPDPPVPVGLNAVFEVVDLDQQTIKDSKQIVVHPSEYYLGFYFVNGLSQRKDQGPIRMELVVANCGKIFSLEQSEK